MSTLLAGQDGTVYTTVPVPSPRVPRPVEATSDLRGSRVLLVRPEGIVRDVRAISNVEDHEGKQVVRVCSERDWYLWQIVGTPPKVQRYPIRLIYIE